MTPVEERYCTSGIKDIYVSREHTRAYSLARVDNPRAKKEAGRARSRKTDEDRRDLSVRYKPKVEGATKTGTVPFWVHSTFRHRTGLGTGDTGTEVYERKAGSRGHLTSQ
jgi:hypothetical protein